MADSISHRRIVPIMSPARLTSRPGGKGPGKQTGGAKMLQEEDLHIECLKERRLYAVPTPGDGECHCIIALRNSWDDIANRCHIFTIKKAIAFSTPFPTSSTVTRAGKEKSGNGWSSTSAQTRHTLCSLCRM